MKKIRIVLAAALAALMLLTLLSCKDDAPAVEQAVYRTVSFSTGGSEIEPIRVIDGGIIEKPHSPTRDGYVFDRWTTSDGKDWNFKIDKVTSDITLVAQWLDAETVYSYQPFDGGVRITGVLRALDEMAVPGKIRGLEVKSIGEGVFSAIGSESTSEITVAQSVTSIEKDAFKNCTGIKIRINGALKYVGEGAFFGCDLLSSVTFAEGLTTVPYQAFAGCLSLTEIRLPSSVTFVDENAFEDCEAIKTVVFYPTLEKISDRAFSGCSSLVRVCYMGAADAYEELTVEGVNSEILNATVYFYSQNQPDDQGDYFYFDSKGNVEVW